MKTILEDNKLNIKEERILIPLLEKFLDHRESNPDLPTPPEDDPKKKTDNLTQAELDARALVAEEEKKQKDADDEAKKQSDE